MRLREAEISDALTKIFEMEMDENSLESDTYEMRLFVKWLGNNSGDARNGTLNN